MGLPFFYSIEGPGFESIPEKGHPGTRMLQVADAALVHARSH
jgi:hypothetical protein